MAEALHAAPEYRGWRPTWTVADHLAAHLAPVVADLIAAAEQRGREDNAEHSLCYVHGSPAYEALYAQAKREGAEEVRARVEAVISQWPTGDNGQDYRAAVTQCATAIRRALGGTAGEGEA